jgi:hypothetical protein
VAGWLGSNWIRVTVYLCAAVAAAAAGWRERHWVRTDRDLWPAFWFGTAALLLVMAVGRATDAGGWVSALGRSFAQSEGWYRHRRRLQVAAVGSVGLVWLGIVGVSLWRVPARRRRYLPAVVAVVSLLCFVGLRLVSLHQIDGLLERRHVDGVKVGAILELAAVLLVATTAAMPLPPTGATQVSSPDALR